MKSVVVYESHWGNTAAIADAIAAGIGPGAVALTTDEATGAALDGADLVVAGAPVMGLRLPTERALLGMAGDRKAPREPDTSHPSMRSWLDRLPAGSGRGSAFETGLRWSPGGATGAIEHGLEAAGYRRLAKSPPVHRQGGVRPAARRRARGRAGLGGRARGHASVEAARASRLSHQRKELNHHDQVDGHARSSSGA